MKAEDIKGLTGLEKVQDGVIKAVEAFGGGLVQLKEEVIEAVKCCECGTIHNIEKETYLTLVGNLHVGSHGGLLGNGNWNENGVPTSYWCVEKGCLSSFLLAKEHDIKERNIIQSIK